MIYTTKVNHCSNGYMIAAIFERFLPVMNAREQADIMAGCIPDHAALNKWLMLLRKRNERVKTIFCNTKYYRNDKG